MRNDLFTIDFFFTSSTGAAVPLARELSLWYELRGCLNQGFEGNDSREQNNLKKI